ncbi:MAG TPA: FAD-dependent oxidoreductase [Candidatus Limnocylindria bacterium]|nr:FAD-dependent oxidoreductase [Candidatus Limnocylindria bacterium]
MDPRHVDVLLIGGGVASARCARTLRRNGFSGSILLVGDEDLPPYNRPPLSKELLREELPSELTLAEPMSWYERRAVQLLLSTVVASLDPEARTATLDDGSRIHFGQLLLATGAQPRRPSFPGAERARLLRTLPDAVALREGATPGGRAVVIGGGFIGVEVASSLAARGLHVTLLERTPELWAGSLGERLSAWAVERLAEAGVTVRPSASVSSIGPGGVVLGDQALPADLVVAGVGVEPRIGLAAEAGLEVDDGVLVDAAQRTSAPGIFAAGDMARPRDGVRIEHWHAAREGGERAAFAMLGGDVPAPRAPWIFSEVAGVTVDVVGATTDWDDALVRGGVHAYLAGGRVVQVAVIDGAVAVEAARRLVEGGGSPRQLEALLAN